MYVGMGLRDITIIKGGKNKKINYTSISYIYINI